MTQPKERQRIPELRSRDNWRRLATSIHYGFAGSGTSMQIEDLEESMGLGEEFPSPWDLHGRLKVRGHLPEPVRAIEQIESKLERFEKTLQSAIDIGLENRTLLEQLNEGGSRAGLGAIHSLDGGEVQLKYPLIYSYQEIDDQVVVGIEEFGIYGLGSTEDQAVKDVQDELWHLVQDLERTPHEQLGPNLLATLKTIQARIHRDAVDA